MRFYMRNAGRPRIAGPFPVRPEEVSESDVVQIHEDEELDEALDDTFPASDPVASLHFD